MQSRHVSNQRHRVIARNPVKDRENSRPLLNKIMEWYGVTAQQARREIQRIENKLNSS